MAKRKSCEAKDDSSWRVLIVDDHPIVRSGLEAVINQEEELEVCGGAGDASRALQAAVDLNPDLAIVDISLPGGPDGIQLIKDLRSQCPDLLILVLSMHHESEYAEQALRAGARGYVTKQEPSDDLIKAIRQVLAGDLYVNDKLAGELVLSVVRGRPEVGRSPVSRLSDRELEVFQMVGRGLGTRQIADTLHLSVKTIETYRKHIKEKLGLAHSCELLERAIQWVHSRGSI